MGVTGFWPVVPPDIRMEIVVTESEMAIGLLIDALNVFIQIWTAQYDPPSFFCEPLGFDLAWDIAKSMIQIVEKNTNVKDREKLIWVFDGPERELDKFNRDTMSPQKKAQNMNKATRLLWLSTHPRKGEMAKRLLKNCRPSIDPSFMTSIMNILCQQGCHVFQANGDADLAIIAMSNPNGVIVSNDSDYLVFSKAKALIRLNPIGTK